MLDSSQHTSFLCPYFGRGLFLCKKVKKNRRIFEKALDKPHNVRYNNTCNKEK